MGESLNEPWLRGIRLAVDPVVEPVLFALQQVREDLAKHVGGTPDERIWHETPGIPTLGFQLKHIAGSLDRLTTYLEGSPLSDGQADALRNENTPGASGEQLLIAVDAAISHAEKVVASIEPRTFADTRYVGRKRIPTTVIGLAVHIAEHTQRHCGQAITTAKLLGA